MKLNKWLYGATALAMLAACSDKDIAPDSGGGVPEEGFGYVGVRIQMPTIPSTRANDDFSDGVSSEYTLNDAVLVLFQGTDQRTAKCVGAFELKKSQLNPDIDNDHNQITTQVKRVATVTGFDISSNNKLYALVIANGIGNKLYPINGSKADLTKINARATEDTDGGTTIVEKAIDVKGKTIQWFQEAVVSSSLCTQQTPGNGYASNMLMTNSPLTTVKGGNNPVSKIENAIPVLVELKSEVWPTEAQALDNPSGTIHIERALGKITCSVFNKNTGVEVTVGDKKYDLVVDQIKWGMAQDMTTSYLVRNTNRVPVNTAAQGSANLWKWNYASDFCDESIFAGDAGKYRMLGHTPIISTLYRPYFCQVPGYGVAKDDIYEDKTFNNEIINSSNAVDWNSESAFYPRENTFPVEYMKYGNTTRIGFWVNFKFLEKGTGTADSPAYLDVDGKNFYTKGLDKSTIYFDDEHGENPIASRAIAELTADSKIKEVVEAAMDKTSLVKYEDLYLGDFLNFSYEKTDDGEIIINNIEFKSFNDPVYTSEKYADWFKEAPGYIFGSDLITSLNNLEQVYEYTGGWTFYEVRIKHFGDDLTPWIIPANGQASTIDESYGPADSRANNYLGRYGIVRNNWYDLNVEIITKLGDPQDPAKWDNSWPGKPDDNKDEYISVILRVLSWAKRTQSTIF